MLKLANDVLARVWWDGFAWGLIAGLVVAAIVVIGYVRSRR